MPRADDAAPVDAVPTQSRGIAPMSDETEFVRLFRENYAAVRRFIERRVVDGEAAADLTMDCFEIAWRKRVPSDPFGLPWLYRTARNLIANEYRRRDREEALRAHTEQLLRTLTDPAEAEMTKRLLDAVHSLPEYEREILWLTYWEGLSAAEVAIVLEVSAGSVWTRLNRVRARIRPLLSEPDLPVEEVHHDRR